MSDNMKLWDAVSKTDPANTKRVNQRGGFTAIAAHSQIREATRQFGPVGIGWGYEVGAYQIVDKMIIVPVTLWHGDRSNTFGPVLGCAEMFGNRPDSDAPKKATTDAITKGLSQLGFNADVFLGRYDDNKYVQQMEREFTDGHQEPQQGRKQPPALKGPIKTRAELRTACGAFVRDLNGCSDADMLKVVLEDNAALIKQVEDEHELYWKGDGADFLGLEKEIERAKAHLMDDSWRENVLRAG